MAETTPKKPPGRPRRPTPDALAAARAAGRAEGIWETLRLLGVGIGMGLAHLLSPRPSAPEPAPQDKP